MPDKVAPAGRWCSSHAVRLQRGTKLISACQRHTIRRTLPSLQASSKGLRITT